MGDDGTGGFRAGRGGEAVEGFDQHRADGVLVEADIGVAADDRAPGADLACGIDEDQIRLVVVAVNADFVVHVS